MLEFDGVKRKVDLLNKLIYVDVRIWDETNAKALISIYCVYVFSLFGLPL